VFGSAVCYKRHVTPCFSTCGFRNSHVRGGNWRNISCKSTTRLIGWICSSTTKHGYLWQITQMYQLAISTRTTRPPYREHRRNRCRTRDLTKHRQQRRRRYQAREPWKREEREMLVKCRRAVAPNWKIKMLPDCRRLSRKETRTVKFS
jgi:hypothetical protein